LEHELTRRPHQPFLREAEGSDTAALLVHGVFGSPRQFHDIADALLAQGCSVMAILLPGHGGSAKDFCEVKSGQWRQAVSEAAAFLRRRYRRVFLIGHSLGSLLCVLEAAAHEASGLVLMSAPLRLKSGAGPMRISARVLLGDPARDDDYIKSYRLANSVGAGSLLQYIRWLPRMAELLSLMRQARRALPLVKQRVLIIQSRRDETVSWRSVRLLKRGLAQAASVDALILERSGHAYFPPEEAAALRQRICGFIQAESRRGLGDTGQP
jgi:carboxylesterase